MIYILLLQVTGEDTRSIKIPHVPGRKQTLTSNRTMLQIKYISSKVQAQRNKTEHTEMPHQFWQNSAGRTGFGCSQGTGSYCQRGLINAFACLKKTPLSSDRTGLSIFLWYGKIYFIPYNVLASYVCMLHFTGSLSIAS